jgi:predicted alpha/beta superfamily hydrolase
MHLRKVYAFLCFLFIQQLVLAQHEAIIIGEKLNIHSNLLNEDREIWIHTPGEANDSIYAPKSYPVIYLLDGDAHFYSVMGMIRQLSSINGNTVLPKSIIVGITNNNRMLDLTPTSVSALFGNPMPEELTGRGDLFLDFLEKELIPYVESNYYTSPDRTIIGHSLGGLMVLHALSTSPDLFNNYLAIDPSLWWDDHVVLENTKQALSNAELKTNQLYVAIANTIGENADVEEIMKDTSMNNDHFRSIQSFVNFLDNAEHAEITYSWDYFANDDHGSVPLIAEYTGLRFFNEMYRINDLDRLFDPESGLSAEDKKQFVADHFIRLTKIKGYEIKPYEDLINQLAYGFMQNKMNDAAELFFKWNVDLYPESSNVYDSLGDLYVAKGEEENAKSMFRLAIKLKNHPASVRKLQELEQK